MLLVTGAGTGGVLLLRWYWWRINAWSEVSAMLAAFVTSITLQGALHMDSDDPRSFAWIMIITVSVTTVVWLTVTFLTPAEPRDVLVAFYRRTRPSVAGWSSFVVLSYPPWSVMVLLIGTVLFPIWNSPPVTFEITHSATAGSL